MEVLRLCGYELRVTVSSENHRVVEEARNLWTSPGPTPPAQAGSPTAAQHHVPMAFEYLQEWRRNDGSTYI